MTKHALMYGGTPVPWTVSWSDELAFTVGREPLFSDRRAIIQRESPGTGKPIFSKPHTNRQRRAIARGLCDLCAKPIAMRTKVSLSHARPVMHGARGWAILQVEPLVHADCAVTCIDHCPSLRRDISAGTLMVRQVQSYSVQCAVMDAVFVETFTGQSVTALGHAKVELVKWVDRDEAWLREKAARS